MPTRFRVLTVGKEHAAFAASDRGLRRVFLPNRLPALKREIRELFPDAVEDPQLLPALAGTLTRYFAGEQVEFDVKFDWSGHSSFEIDVWRACAAVGYGRTCSYKYLAERLRSPQAARAVGMAMSHNPFPIIVPCHRVLRSDGSIGGYSGPGGIEFKRRLLDMEAAAAVAHA